MAPPPVLKSRGDGPPPQQCSFRNTTPFCLKSPKLQKGGAPLQGQVTLQKAKATKARSCVRLRVFLARVTCACYLRVLLAPCVGKTSRSQPEGWLLGRGPLLF